MPTIFVNGLHLVHNGITGNAGDKDGVASIQVPVVFPSLAVVFSIAAEEVAAAVGLSGLRCTDRPLSELENGMFLVTFTFEGFNEEVNFEEGEEKATYRFSPEMQDAPMETLPHFKQIVAEFGPLVEGKFPETYTPKKTGGNALPGNSGSQSAAKENPFFGWEAWLKAGGTFSKSWAASRVPAHVMQGIGTIIEFPPGADKVGLKKSKKRRWIKLAPDIQYGEKGAGSAARITENYRMFIASKGAEDIIYDRQQLD